MFAKLTLTLAAILAVATAAPNAPADSGSCSTGTLQCCNKVDTAGSAGIASVLSLLGVVVQDLDIPIGLGCSGITAVGVGSAGSCSTQAVCCDSNATGGIGIGCLPLSL